MKLDQDFREFLQSLSDNGVRYLLVGGYAVAAHGHPRYTKDLDVWIEATPENAGRVMRALDQFGFGGLPLRAADLAEPGRIVQLGYPPNRIDLLTSVTGVSFDECFESRLAVAIDGTPVNVIDLDHLRKNKAATGRPQDLADLDHLRPMNRK